MLSKNHLKKIKSLHQAKQRRLAQLFVVEGVKPVAELLASNFEIVDLFYTEAPYPLPEFAVQVDQAQLQALSALSAANKVLAIAKMPKIPAAQPHTPGLKIALDAVSDPGNMGTILRLADWFAVDEVIVGERCVELFNPKVVQAAMGSLFRVKLAEAKLSEFLPLAAAESAVYGAVLDSSSIYSAPFQENAIVVFGSESHGIAAELEPFLTHRVSIPRYGGAESLNVAMAAGIIMAEWRRPK